MSVKHQLSLEIPDTTNVHIFRVVDTSMYSTDLEVKCNTLQIVAPGFTYPVNIEVLPNFNLVLNACTLGLSTTGCAKNTPALPDGIYCIKYSVSPNEDVYVEYRFLRAAQIMTLYNRELGRLDLVPNDPTSDIVAKLDELRLIKSFIDAAKVQVEDLHESNRGMDLFLYAKKRLERMRSGCHHCN